MLLVLLGLVILLIALVLFVPIRMKLTANKGIPKEEYDCNLKVNWLLHFISIKVMYSNAGLVKSFKILGIDILALKERIANRREAARKKRLAKAKIPEKNKKKKEKKNISSCVLEEYNEATGKIEATDTTIKPDGKKVDSADNSENSDIDDIVYKNVFEKVKSFVSTVVEFILNIKDKLLGIKDKLIHIYNNASYYYNVFFEDRHNRNAMDSCKTELVRILKAVRPRKVKGYINVGFDDPAATGQALAIMAVIYPFLGEGIIVEPDFDNEVFKGDILIKSRLYLITLLVVGFKIYFNKEIKRFFRMVKGVDNYGK